MNLVWSIILLICMLILLILNPNAILKSFINGSENALNLSLKLWAIYAVWLGILKIVEETKLDQKLTKLLNPLIDFLFGKTNNLTKNYISINIASNIFGMGNASTPSGIEAMKGLDVGSKYITASMAMLFILNICNLQIIPTTILSLRLTHSSSNPNSIILPTILTSLVSTFTGIILVKLCKKLFNKGKTLWVVILFLQSLLQFFCTHSSLNRTHILFLFLEQKQVLI